jgi:P pilus assembly chaperone PapD
MRVHPYLRVLPRVRYYVAKPLRAGCFASSSLVVLLLFILTSRLLGQVDAVLVLHGRDAEMRVANPTAKPLLVSVTLFADSTLTDSVPTRISPKQFTLAPGGSQVVRLRLHARMTAGAGYRLGTLFTPVESPVSPRRQMQLVLATRIITRVQAGP